MKHFFLLVASILAIAAYSSCKKEYTCECVHVKTLDTTKSLVFQTSEKKAIRQCKEGNGQVSSYYNCKLK